MTQQKILCQIAHCPKYGGRDWKKRMYDQWLCRLCSSVEPYRIEAEKDEKLRIGNINRTKCPTCGARHYENTSNNITADYKGNQI
jgi:hypothetical protein